MAMASEGKANIISDQYAAVSLSSLCCSLLKASRTSDCQELNRLLLRDCQHQPPPRLPTRPADHTPRRRDEHILSPLTRLTYQGDTALHMVAASGSDDAENFLKSADDIICRSGRAMELLVTPNCNGDTPLHSAATAGNLAVAGADTQWDMGYSCTPNFLVKKNYI